MNRNLIIGIVVVVVVVLGIIMFTGGEEEPAMAPEAEAPAAPE